jgi:hypothetical protein
MMENGWKEKEAGEVSGADDDNCSMAARRREERALFVRVQR